MPRRLPAEERTPYLLMETRFGIASSEKEDWTDALIQAVGSRDQECPYCSDSQRVDAPEETHNWVVEGLLPTAGSSILHGKPKQRKSTLARQLAFCVSTNGPFLGRKVLQEPVLYIALEEKKSEVWNHFESLGSDGSEPISTIFDYRGNRLGDIRDLITSLKPVLVSILCDTSLSRENRS